MNLKHINSRTRRDVPYRRRAGNGAILMELLHREEGLVVGDNEPYSVTDASDYTIPVHGEQRDLHHVALEIRQDLITDEAGQRMWAALFARLLPQAYRRLTSLQISTSN
jgi:predicted N-formylglutamate amidohydrolase